MPVNLMQPLSAVCAAACLAGGLPVGAQTVVNVLPASSLDAVQANRADVFVTESAEAITQQKLKPGLCAINPDKPLQYGEMAWMLPRGDVAFKAYVDQWLHLSKAGGEYQRVEAQWLK